MNGNRFIINNENLDWFGYTNDDVVSGDVRGICIDFFGLNFTGYVPAADEKSKYLGEHGVVCIHPYTNPWSWMNYQTFDICERLIEVVCERYNLPNNVPVVTAGTSMGGLESYNFAARTCFNVKACFSDCGVTDLHKHLKAFPYTYRSAYSAYYEEGDMEESLREHSPVLLADKLPDADYHIFHNSKDPQVIYEDNALPMYAALRAAGKRVTLETVDDEFHGIRKEEACEKYARLIVESVG